MGTRKQGGGLEMHSHTPTHFHKSAVSEDTSERVQTNRSTCSALLHHQLSECACAFAGVGNSFPGRIHILCDVIALAALPSPSGHTWYPSAEGSARVYVRERTKHSNQVKEMAPASSVRRVCANYLEHTNYHKLKEKPQHETVAGIADVGF